MALFSRRSHLKAVDLAAVPDTGPPVIVNHRSAGELVGSKVDEMIKSQNRVVDLQCELGRAEEKLRQDQLELAAAVKELGLPPDVVATISRRGEG